MALRKKAAGFPRCIFSRNRSFAHGKKKKKRKKKKEKRKKKSQNVEGKSVFNWKSIKLKRNVVCRR